MCTYKPPASFFLFLFFSFLPPHVFSFFPEHRNGVCVSACTHAYAHSQGPLVSSLPGASEYTKAQIAWPLCLLGLLPDGCTQAVSATTFQL